MPTQDPILAADSSDKRVQASLKEIKHLEDKLNRLNILENPLEIENICRSIIGLKKNLRKTS